MRLVVYLLSFYIIFLAAIPCRDAICIDDHYQSHCSISQSKENNNHSDQDCCSPLCICNCCASAISKIKSIQYNSITFQVIRVYISPYLADIISISTRPIWQPPKK